MSPEQTRGEDVDHRTDIWAFGVVLYEMLTGQFPFKGDYEQAVIYSILNEEPDLSNVPAEARGIVQKALAKQLEERYSAEALAARQGASEAIVERLSTLSAEVALSGSDWEREFVTSLCDQAQIRELSQRQIEILEKIESRFISGV